MTRWATSPAVSVTAPTRPATEVTSEARPSTLSQVVPSKKAKSPAFHWVIPLS